MEPEKPDLKKLARELEARLKIASPLVEWTIDVSDEVGWTDTLLVWYRMNVGHASLRGIFPLPNYLLHDVKLSLDEWAEYVATRATGRLVHEAMHTRL